jgi:cytochrome c-type biogenesis protein CcmE
MKRLSGLALAATALAFLLAAPTAGHAQQIPAGQSEVQQDVDKRTKRVTLPGEREQARCYSGILIDAFRRYGVFGTIGTMPTELINVMPAGANAVLYYCNENYAACEAAAMTYRDRLGMAPGTCN